MPARHDLPGARSFVPQADDLAALARAVQDCLGCDLFRRATQAVFGRGRPDAPLVMVGEQPGDAEDQAGRPWHDAELARLAPDMLVTLGATAGQALLGSSFRVNASRGAVLRRTAPAAGEAAGRDIAVVATIHLSAVLRWPVT